MQQNELTPPPSCRVAILGASGYTGGELLRLLLGHSSMHIAALAAHTKAGNPIHDVHPHVRGFPLPPLATLNHIDFTDIDLVFAALPHTASASVIANLPQSVRIVDLSADFRLKSTNAYQKWYGNPHAAPHLLAQSVYGLTEFYRESIRTARLVAGTGCNAAAGQYALRPLIEAGCIDLDNIIIDLKTGVSGAGRQAKQNLLFAEVAEGVTIYNAGGQHRHLAEFDQELSALAGQAVCVQFTPHLLPFNRGILVTVYVVGAPDTIHKVLMKRYESEPFCRVLPFGHLPKTHSVRGSHFVDIGVIGDRAPNRAIVAVALDNLTKGASGQAIHNANVMFGFPETLGLFAPPMCP